MKFAFSSNAFRNFSLENTIEIIHDIGYSGIELMCDVPHAYPPLKKESIDSISNSLKKNNMEISNLNGFMLTAIQDFHHPSWIENEKKFRTMRIEHTKNCIKLAELLGAQTVSTEPGGPKTNQSRSKEIEHFENGINEVIPIAENLGISLLIEPEPELLIENSKQFINFIEKFDSKFLGLNFDIGHFFCVNESPEQLIIELKDYIKHVHLEDISKNRIHNHLIPGHGSIDFEPIFHSLHDIKYSGFITVELYPYQNEPEKAARESLEFITKIIQNV